MRTACAKRKRKRAELSVFKGREGKLNHATFQILALKGPQSARDSERERRVRLIRLVARDVAYEVMDEHLDDYKHKEKLAEEFDLGKFVVSPIVGAIARIMAACYGYTYAQTVTWLVTSGFMLWIEYAGKSIVRQFWK